MPEKYIPIWEIAIGLVTTLLIFLGLKSRDRKAIDDGLRVLHARVNMLENKHAELRVEIAKDYPTTPRIEKLMEQGFRQYAAEMRNIILNTINETKK